MDCQVCRAESGTSLVCNFCRRQLTDYQKEKLTRILTEIVRERAYDPGRDQFQCFHCREWFARDEICADHFPFTKARRPDLRFDLRNVKPCCQRDNTSGSNTRRKPTADDLTL